VKRERVKIEDMSVSGLERFWTSTTKENFPWLLCKAFEPNELRSKLRGDLDNTWKVRLRLIRALEPAKAPVNRR
jgi:hypothetical protein